MKRMSIVHPVTAMILGATFVALAASWLIAGVAEPVPEPTVESESSSPVGDTSETPLPDFLPSEQLPAGSAVAFPTDI
jgi:hypothetical protein